MGTQLPRGMRDFPPEEKIFRDEVVGKLRTTFEQFGFAPLETPTLERFDVLSAKYAGGDEILKETFSLTDQGKRKLGMRYDLTVPLARFISMNPNVKLPFKRYQIEKVYRDGPIKLGRYREFYQCDCDIVGVNSALADVQCMQVSLAGFSSLGINVTLSMNNIALLKAMLTKDGVKKSQLTDAMLIIDKLKKIGKAGVEKELAAAKIPKETVTNVLKIADIAGNDERLQAIVDTYGEIDGVERVRDVLALVTDDRVTFDPSLSRGLAYYTGMVFEVFAVDSEVKVSLSGGGRYDTMIGGFVGRLDDFPAVGISFGLEPIMDVLRESGVETKSSLTQAFIIPIKTVPESNALAQELRANSINTDIDLSGRGISKNLDYANAQGIPYVLILGKKELDEGVITVKEMSSGDEQQLKKEDLLTYLKERV